MWLSFSTTSPTVEDESGMFHARRKQMGVTALVPGLQVQVQGNYNAQNQLVANTVKFNGKNLKPPPTSRLACPVEQQEQAAQQKMAAAASGTETAAAAN